MERALGWIISASLALVLVGSATSSARSGRRIAAACIVSPVGGSTVHAGVISGGIAADYDVVDGRFRLHVGPYRDVERGLTQKILWWLPQSYRVGARLVVRGHTLSGRKRTVTQRFWEAGTSDSTRRYFPSIVSPPSAGCWRLTLQTGKVRNALTVRVDE
jgi:hypothetical protein